MLDTLKNHRILEFLWISWNLWLFPVTFRVLKQLLSIRVGGTTFRPSMIRSPVASINEGQWPNCVQNTQCFLNVQSSHASIHVRLFVIITSGIYIYIFFFIAFHFFLSVKTNKLSGDKSENCNLFITELYWKAKRWR